MLYFILFIALYSLCFYGAYKYMQSAHLKGGRWQNLNPDIGDLYMVILPGFNFVFAIMYLLGTDRPSGPSKIKPFDGNKFFKISK